MRSRLQPIVVALVIVACSAAAGIVGLVLSAPRIICHLGDVRRTKAAADIKGIVEALETYRLDHGAVPTTDEGLGKMVQPQHATGYLLKVPIDPWGNPYAYSSDGRTFAVLSFGADGRPGGDDKDADLSDWSAFATY